MGNNRYGKTTPPRVDYTSKEVKKKAVEVNPLTFSACIVCTKQIVEGFYGRWGAGGVCCKTCNVVMEARPKYPDHPFVESS